MIFTHPTLTRYAFRLRKWVRYATGTSYQHVHQGRGNMFKVGALEGYFNDLTGKADWRGRWAEGVPVVQTDTVPRFHFPIAIFQWALGNWDRWLMSGRSDGESLSLFLVGANWAVAALDESFGWKCWNALQRPTSNPYSAMAQGQGLSVLARAATISHDESFHAAALRAFKLLEIGAPHGLVVSRDGRICLEEYPGGHIPGVLNGWIFALFGVYDFALLTKNPTNLTYFLQLSHDLALQLHEFDRHYWSDYDLSGNISSPFYHALHISQLRALAETAPNDAHVFAEFADIFDEQRKQPFNKMKSVMIKIKQKAYQTRIGEMA